MILIDPGMLKKYCNFLGLKETSRYLCGLSKLTRQNLNSQNLISVIVHNGCECIIQNCSIFILLFLLAIINSNIPNKLMKSFQSIGIFVQNLHDWPKEIDM